MLSQNHPELIKNIQLYGCNMMCIMWLVRTDWDAPSVNKFYLNHSNTDYLSKNCYVSKPQLLLAALGTNIRQLGGIDSEDVWGCCSSLSQENWPILSISKYQTTTGYHFIASNGGIFYDPYDKSIASYNLQITKKVSTQYYG